MTHDELKHTALQQPAVRAAYEALGPEFEILRQMLQARQACWPHPSADSRAHGHKAACRDALGSVPE